MNGIFYFDCEREERAQYVSFDTKFFVQQKFFFFSKISV